MKRLLHILSSLYHDPQKKSLALTALFYASILLSAYVLFRLPDNLIYQGGMTSTGQSLWVFGKAFIVVFVAFGLGIIANIATHKIKKEIVVFKEASTQQSSAEAEAEEAANQVDKKTFEDELKSAKKNERKQVGLNAICKLLQAGQGVWYETTQANGTKSLALKASFALPVENETAEFAWGEGLVGQAAASGKNIYLDELPEGYNNAILSGLGQALPKFLFVASIKKQDQVVAVLEIATFAALSENAKNQAIDLANLLVE
jgi:hypothetical protein